MDADHGLYLRLSDDFGGTRFGPFEGIEVCLGYDESNDITIPENFGVEEAHAKVLNQEGRGILITPVAQTTAVYVWKGRANKPTQISTPTAVRHGDSFSLVSPQGPRFFIEIDLLPEDVLKSRRSFRGQENLNKDAMKKEARRQAILRVMTTGWGQRFGRIWWFFRSGEAFQPRNIFLMTAILGGWVLGGLTMCGKADADKDNQVLTTQLEDNNNELAQCLEDLGAGDKKGYTLAAQLDRVLGTKSFKYIERYGTREQDLIGRVRFYGKQLYQRRRDHAWLSDPRGGQKDRLRAFNALVKKVQKWKDLDPATQRILPWAGTLHDAYIQDDNTLWGYGKDVRAEDVCRRGPFGMTWTQAYQLELSTQLDLFAEAEEVPTGAEDIYTSLRKSAKRAKGFDRETIPEEPIVLTKRPGGDDDSFCLVVEGTDYRDDPDQIKKKLRPGRGGLPSYDPKKPQNNALIAPATLVKFFGADTKGTDFRDLRMDFTDGLADGLGSISEKGEDDWVLDRTAETIARSAVIPCIRRTVFQDKKLPKKWSGKSDAYDPLACILLQYVIENGDVEGEDQEEE